jgi:signal transduction histidine kinase
MVPGKGFHKIRPLIAQAVLACSLICHAAVVVEFIITEAPRQLYFESSSVFFVYIAVSAVLSVAMYLTRKISSFHVLLISRVMLFIVFTMPFGLFFSIRLQLLLVLLLEVSIYENYPFNLLYSLFVIASSVVFSVLSPFPSRSTLAESYPDLITYLLCATIVAVLGGMMTFFRERMVASERKMRRQNATLVDLAKAQMGFLDLARTAGERSMLSERRRLTAELHDSLGYTFTNLKMLLEASMDLIEIDPGKLRELLEIGYQQVQEGMRSTRNNLHQLRDAVVVKTPFLAAVHQMCKVFEKSTGVHIAIDYTNFPQECDTRAESALFHFIQEGLVNSFSHGKATMIRVVFWLDNESMQVRIEDNGIGIGTITEGIGIHGMRERLGKLGGTLSLQPMSEGFKIVATVPVSEDKWTG